MSSSIVAVPMVPLIVALPASFWFVVAAVTFTVATAPIEPSVLVVANGAVTAPDVLPFEPCACVVNVAPPVPVAVQVKNVETR